MENDVEFYGDGPGDLSPLQSNIPNGENESSETDANAGSGSLKKGDRIILSMPQGQRVRLTVMGVGTDGNYTFSDGSVLSSTSLADDGYSWVYDDAVAEEKGIPEAPEKEVSEGA